MHASLHAAGKGKTGDTVRPATADRPTECLRFAIVDSWICRKWMTGRWMPMHFAEVCDHEYARINVATNYHADADHDANDDGDVDGLDGW